MSTSPLVSVVMPVYNSENYVGTAIDSILNQTYTDFEFIIIDDKSSDGSLAVIERYTDPRIRLLKNADNLRTTVTLNKGVRAALGEFIVRMDADDWSFPDRISKQVAFMQQNADVVECGGSIVICDKDLNVINTRKYPITDSQIRSKIFFYNPFAHPATIWRRGAIENAGYYDEKIPLTQDYDLTFRVGKLGKLANLPDTIVKLRTHEKSSSQEKSRQQEFITLQIRFKAISKYGYTMNFTQRIYLLMQWLSMFIIPQKLKFKLFNAIRRFY